jgi:hypothetical protein
MDWWMRLEGRGAVVLHLRPSASLPWVNARVRRPTRQRCQGVERIRVSRRATTFFLLAASYRFCGDYGAWQGSKWSSARPEARVGGAGR